MHLRAGAQRDRRVARVLEDVRNVLVVPRNRNVGLALVVGRQQVRAGADRVTHQTYRITI